MHGYQALRNSAAWFDLSSRGRIRTNGEDRKRLLHAMSTNHVEQLQPGQGVYAFFLNSQGRIQGDAAILCFEDHLLIDVEPEVRRGLYEHLDKFIIADDVTLEDVTAATAEIGVAGPHAAALLSNPPSQLFHFTPWRGGIALKYAADEFRIIIPAEDLEAAVAALGIEEAGPVARLTVRLEQGRPRFGDDILDKHLVQETQQMHAVHFSKGCYLGQEIVERVRSRGLVHRLLVPLRIQGDVSGGIDLMNGEKKAGEVMSAAWSPAEQATRAMGYVRLDAMNAALTAGGQPVEIVQRP